MTKRMLFMLCAGLIIVSMAACTGDEQQSSNTADASLSEDAASASLQATQSHEQLYQFMKILSDSLVLSDSWDRADDLRADVFSAFYYRMILLTQYPDGWDTMLHVPSKDVEDVITQYFDVSIEHLRTAENYDAAENCYSFSYGIGSGGKFEIDTVVESDDIVTVSYRQYDLGDNPVRDGVVKLKKEGEHCKILCCTTMEMN